MTDALRDAIVGEFQAGSLTRGAFRVMGTAKTSLMLGIYAAATNLRLRRI